MSAGGPPVLVLMPVLDDWTAAERLLGRLAEELRGEDWGALLVDDGSLAPAPDGYLAGAPDLAARVEVLELRRNLGHQRAIAIGLAWLHAERSPDVVVVMDADGEDSPADVPRLLAAFRADGGGRIVFAERRRRAEGLLFRVLYRAYRAAHRVLTGFPVRVGNFSVVPAGALERLVVTSETWIHYAAAVMRTRIPHTTLPTHRAARLDGRTTMRMTELVVHGLSAISVYGEIVGVRVLTAASAVVGVAGLGLAALAGRWAAGAATPGWVAVAAGILLLAMLQLLTFALVFLFLTLAGRQSATFLPLRDFRPFVRRLRQLPSEEAGGRVRGRSATV